MSKQDKLKKMWQDLPSMEKDQIMRELHALNATISYEEIVERLKGTYDDLKVADYIFETYPIDDTKSAYPKEFIDEAITLIARKEQFDFTHYGNISQDITLLKDAMISKTQRDEKYKELFQKLFQLCKKFGLDNYDALIYSINDQVDMGAEFLTYLRSLQKNNTKEDEHEVIRCVDRFLQTFQEMNPYLEEQLHYVQATSYIALRSSKGEKMFLQMMKDFPDKSEVIYHYALAYQKIDAKKMMSILKRFEKEIDKDSDIYPLLLKLKG